MLIILEGVDRTGKTTLADWIKNAYNLEYRHYSKPEQHPLDEYGRWLDGPVPRTVVDRYHLGERVWPRIFGRESEYDDAMHRWIELLLESRGAVLIRTVRDLREVEEAAARDGEPIQGDQILVASGLMAQEVAASILPHYEMNVIEGGDHNIPIHAAVRAMHARYLADVTTRWVGHIEPDVLLVGDEVGPSSQGWNLPFVPYRGSSGHFLMSELRLTGLKPAIVNSVAPSGEQEDVRALWEALGRPPLVPLGRLAESRVRDLADATGIPHPQWWRRFNRKAGVGSYGQLLQEAIS